MIYEVFAGAATYSRELMIAAMAGLLALIVLWIRRGGPGVRRDSDIVLTPIQVLTRALIELIGVGVGFSWYVWLIGARALVPPDSTAQVIIRFPAALLDLIIPATVNVNRDVLMMHGSGAFGMAVGAGFLLHRQLRPGSFVYELVDRMRLPARARGSAGSSHFCTVQEYRRYFHPSLNGINLYGAFWGQKTQSGFHRLDKGEGAFCLTAEDAARGILALGAPGSGKTQALILPTIADRMRVKQSMIVVDPQGELKRYVLEIAGLTGHRVAIHDPTDKLSPRFNLAQGIKDVSDARAIAEVLVPFSPDPSERFWSDSAANLLAASLLRFNDLGSIYYALSDLEQFASVLGSQDDGACTLAGSFISSVRTDARLATNISATLSTALAGWADATVAENTRSSDFSAVMLNDAAKPTIILLTCPGRMRAIYAPYLGATLRKLMIDLDAIGESSEGGSLPNPVSIIIDEFPQLGRISSIVSDVNLVRKRNLAILLAAQTLTQIQMLYGLQGAQSLLTGLATQIVFGGCDLATAEYYSRVSGFTTERIFRKDDEGQQVEVQQKQRFLLTPDEVQSPPRGTAAIFSRFVEHGYAAQVVVLGHITRFYERRDWAEFFKNTMKIYFEVVGKTGAEETVSVGAVSRRGRPTSMTQKHVSGAAHNDTAKGTEERVRRFTVRRQDDHGVKSNEAGKGDGAAKYTRRN